MENDKDPVMVNLNQKPLNLGNDGEFNKNKK